MFSIFNYNIFGQKRSYLWKKIRQKHLDKNPCCAACGSCEKLDVHHIIPVSIDPSKELDQDNLITLCNKYCHFVFGHLMNWKSYNLNIISDASLFLNKIQNRPKE
jgi:hypothetical protein